MKDYFCGLRRVKVRGIVIEYLGRLFPNYLQINNCIDFPLGSLVNVNVWEYIRVWNTYVLILVNNKSTERDQWKW